VTGKHSLDLELKSSKEPKPVYNSGLPKRGVVYIFCSKKYQQTTVFFGQDVVTERKRGLYDDLIKEIRAVVSAHQANPA
jgi:hypothetical protein